MSASPSNVKIIIHAPNGDTRELNLTSVPIVIGRDESADIRVNDKKVSRRHVSFRLSDGDVHVDDLGSVNGVKLDGQKIEGSAVLPANGEVSFGGYRVTLLVSEHELPSSKVPENQMQGDSISQELYAFLEPRMSEEPERSHLEELEASTSQKADAILVGLTEPVVDERFILQSGENIIGRLEDCDVPVLHESISRQHARISLRTGETIVEDLQSSNGTFVNDEKVKESGLSNFDLLKVGNVEFRLELPAQYQGASRSIKKLLPKGKRANKVIGTYQLGAIFVVLAFTAWYFTTDNPISRLSSLFGSGSKVERKDISDNTSAPDLVSDSINDVVDAGQKLVLSKGDNPVTKNEPSMAQPSRTSTSPFGRRDSSGWPVDIPVIDSSFDFDTFVEAKIKKAESQLEAMQFLSAQETLAELREIDPVNSMAKALNEKIEKARAANKQFGRALELEKSGRKLEALVTFKSLLQEESFRERAETKLKESSEQVIRSEIERVKLHINNSKKLRRAHNVLLSVLKLDESNKEARKLIWQLEKKMRKERIRFQTYTGKEKKVSSQISDTKKKSPRERVLTFLSDDELTSAAMHYLSGDYNRALRSLERASSRETAKGKSFEKYLRLSKEKYQRVRTALGNDPSEAWFYLRDFAKAEKQLLPEGMDSFWKNELESSIADAYAVQGDTLFAQQKYAAAFSKWDAGAKLRPNHVKITAGFEKLGTLASQLRTEAELRMQQAKPGACDRWRQITRITKSSSEPYALARKMANQVCKK
ncbi:MAG: FHA domain-containing protein [Myxococcota bacterium]|nr:FHA domain-containing protein [Myxococcota bacterium]